MQIVPAPTLGTSKEASKGVAVEVQGDAPDDDADDESRRSSSVYRSLADASKSASVRPRRGMTRVLYASPRLCFVLVLLFISVATSAFATYHLAVGTLAAAGARHALSTARTQLVATEIALSRATACALREIPAHAMQMRMRVEQALAPWVERLERSDAVVQAAEENGTKCATHVWLGLAKLMEREATSGAQRACLVAALEKTVARYASQVAESSPVVRRVKQFLKTARMQHALAVTSTADSNRTAQIVWLASNTSRSMVALVDAWVDELGADVAKQLETLGISDLQLPALPVTEGLDGFVGVLQGEKKNPMSLVSTEQALTALRAIGGLNRELSRALDALEKASHEIVALLKSLDDRESTLRQEVAKIQNEVQLQAHEMIEAFQNATMRLKIGITTQVRESIDAFTSAAVDLIELNHREDLRNMWKRLPEAHNDLIPKEDDVDPREKPRVEPVKLEVTFSSLQKTLADAPIVVEQGVHRDPWLFRNSIYDTSAVLVTILLTWDFLSRFGWFLGKLATLLTESYSDLPPVDIRDITSITTLIDFWGVLKCRHDLGSVVYAILTEGSYVLQTAVDFVLWVLLEVAGTLGLMEWNRAFSVRCRPHDGKLDISVTTPSAVMTYLLTWIGDSSDRSLKPVATVAKRTREIDRALENDEQAWRKRVHSAARLQSMQLERLMLERRFVLDVRENLISCSIREPVTNNSDVNDLMCSSVDGAVEAEAISAWEPDAADAFRRQRLQSKLNAAAAVAACLARNREPTDASAQIVRRLDHMHSCLVDQTLYLAVASWWMVLVIMLALRLIGRMLTKSAGLVFWRYLSADRLEVLAFSDENGTIQATDRLPKAIRRHLRNIRWRVTARMVGVAIGFSSVLVIGLLVLPSSVLEPLI